MKLTNYLNTLRNIYLTISILSLKSFALSLKRDSTDCFHNDDCMVAQICKDGTCRAVMTVKEIFSKQKCSDVFKKSCQADTDCNCATESLICSANECVMASNRNKQVIETCNRHSDCQVPHFCESNKCREAISLAELKLILLDHGCTSDDECEANEQCFSGNCVKKITIIDKNIKKETNSNICSKDADCLSETLCIKNKCISKLSILRETMCLFKVIGKECIIDSECHQCTDDRRLYCKDLKCGLRR